MDDSRVGAAFRAVRLRRSWRQLDVAEKAGVSASLVSDIERGHCRTLSLDALRNVAAALDIRIDLVARWRGGDLDRLLSARHAALTEVIAAWLTSMGWIVSPEVSFALGGERGFIDLLAWHPSTRTLLIVEVKTEIVDVQETIGTVDRKVRLARRIARDRGWYPATVAKWLAVAEGSTNRTRIATHATILRGAFRYDGRALTSWLRRPVGEFSCLSFVSGRAAAGSGRGPSRNSAGEGVTRQFALASGSDTHDHASHKREAACPTVCPACLCRSRTT